MMSNAPDPLDIYFHMLYESLTVIFEVSFHICLAEVLAKCRDFMNDLQELWFFSELVV